MGTKVYGKGAKEASECDVGMDVPEDVGLLERTVPVLDRPGHAFCFSLDVP